MKWKRKNRTLARCKNKHASERGIELNWIKMKWNVYAHRYLGKIHLLSVESVWYKLCAAAPFQMQTVFVIFHCFVWLILFSFLSSPSLSFSARFSTRSVENDRFHTSPTFQSIDKFHLLHRASENTPYQNDSFLFSCIDHSDLRCSHSFFDCQKVFLFYILCSKIDDEWTKRENKSKSTVLIVWQYECACEYFCCLWIESNWIEFISCWPGIVYSVLCSAVVVILSRDLYFSWEPIAVVVSQCRIL